MGDQAVALGLRLFPVRQLVDKCNRIHDYLRISITENCNLKCNYCRPSTASPLCTKQQFISAEHILFLAAYFVRRGVSKIRLTGGEPLMRKDLPEIIESLNGLRKYNGTLKNISMTTNGIAFAKRAKQFKELGLDSVNISLDSLKPERVKQLTGSPVLKHAYTSIYSALGSGYNPVKLNCVVIRGFNDDEICDFVGLTKHLPIELRFIEFMPFGGNNWDTEKLVSYKEMLNTIRKVYPDLYPLPVPFSNTAKLYRVNDWPGTVGFITSMTENFCSNCSRLRLTADGHLKTCLHGEEEVDLIKVIQQYPLEAADWKDSAVSLFHSQVPQTKLEMVLASLDEKVDIALARKAPEHAGMNQLATGKNRSMIRIGG
ncbi:hypothetical protein T265_11980 [Opisthorchis viverrini]|uniref:Radical SAM core domain-containing protein n=2 Tax=Opisthorchis viverrini TaxID=6198 RepID=A0A074YWL7_OPIVI|nr:hypothetical protein T265_11980 [Opisthorchis viverrini]KER19146.1 hypothetical protein T265_11980 [Opisthorchis viverrini]